MPATSRRLKSEAYEKGIREGKALIARSRGEQSPEEEEMDMGMEPKHSRKRRKPATDGYGMKKPMDGGMYGKKPMDAECGCGKKKGRKCDGNCGAMRKRSDSLTPQEYLTACELGVQDRSTTYIRARLDTAEARNDLKCGRGAISEGEKCTKGPAQKAQPKKPKSQIARARRKAIKTALLAGAAVAVGSTALEVGRERKKAARLALNELKQTKRSANKVFLSQLDVIKRANEKSPNNPGLQQASFRATMQAKGYRDLKRESVRKGLNQLKVVVPPSPARRRGLFQRRRDSIWADGFAPNPEQFAI